MANKRILVIYDYERIVPPFMQSLIHFATERFDAIYYITPPVPDYYAKTISNSKVRIITWTKPQRFTQYLKGVMSILRPNYWKELFKGKINVRAAKYIGQMFFCSDGFIMMSNDIIKNHIKQNDKIYILGTWMAVDAFTSARVKKKYPQIQAYALAHSGEVMIERTPNLYQCFHEYKHQYLDCSYFISSKVLDGYLASMSSFHISERFGNRIKVQYLGSTKASTKLNPINNSGTFHLLSCSRIDANKQLDRIISTLTQWNSGPIKWTHIGTGVLADDIMNKAKILAANNPLITLNFTGRIDNSEVIKYYAETPVDLFVNVSKSEGLPISIMEAMSYGIPCAATDVGGTSEIVNTANGYLLSKDFSDTELLNVLMAFKNSSAEEKEHMRKNAYQTWAEHFNAEKNAMHLYDEWFNNQPNQL